jgi:hypothetical protein
MRESYTTFAYLSIGLAIALFLGMMLFLELGWRYGRHRFQVRGESSRVGVGIVDSAVYALLALLLGFTFSAAAARFDSRKQLVVKQVNALSTAWQRTLMLPTGPREQVRAGLQRYVDALLAVYANPTKSATALAARRQVAIEQDAIWEQSVTTCMENSNKPICVQLLPALNEVFDVVDTERLERMIHIPTVIFVMLGITALAASLFAGNGLAKSDTRNWIYTIGIAATISVTTYVIVELEYPRLGLIRVDQIDRALVEVRQTMR